MTIPGYGLDMAKQTSGTTEQQLKDLAAAEMTAAKQRLATRTTAARRYAVAQAHLTDAAAAWELAQGEASQAKQSAVEDLIASGMKPVDVAQLLGVDAKDLRALRATSHGQTGNQQKDVAAVTTND